MLCATKGAKTMTATPAKGSQKLEAEKGCLHKLGHPYIGVAVCLKRHAPFATHNKIAQQR